MLPVIPAWNIPHRRNPFFTGREDILLRLHDSLRADKTAILMQPQSISGLGGIGKTQTAVEYAYLYQNDYQAILWANASSPELLISSYVTIAEMLDLPEKKEQDQNRVVAAVMKWLRVHAGWLLTLDNVEDLTIVNDLIPTAYRGHILLTTRAEAIGILAQHIKIEKMEPEVGALFLLRRAGIVASNIPLANATKDDQRNAIEIAQEMDGLPLALDQAGAYVKSTKCSLPSYLILYQNQQALLLRDRGIFDSDDYPASVATTWSLSFEKVKKANPSAVELLQFCGFLHPM
jgi:hypothetical protein